MHDVMLTEFWSSAFCCSKRLFVINEIVITSDYCIRNGKYDRVPVLYSPTDIMRSIHEFVYNYDERQQRRVQHKMIREALAGPHLAMDF